MESKNIGVFMSYLKYLAISSSIILLFLLSGCEYKDSITISSNFTNNYLYIDEGYQFVDFKKEYNGEECVVSVRFRKGK